MPRHTILLAEDEESINKMMSNALRGEGYAVLSAGDGQEALALYDARSAEVAMVISDVKMPKMSGIDLRKLLKTYNPRLKMILMSGHFSVNDLIHPEFDEYDRFLAKPFNLFTFLSLVETFLSS